MSHPVESSKHCVMLLAGIAVAASLSGCAPSTMSPPRPQSFVSVGSRMNISYMAWKEGLRVLFVDDVRGGHGATGSSSSGSPVHTQAGVAGNKEAGGYDWKVESGDGRSAKCWINGKEYDLAKGNLFVIKSHADRVEVHQIQRDLSPIPVDAGKARDALEKDAEVQKLLGLDEAGK